MSRDFQIFAPLTFFEKANAPAGEKRRIAGVISTELRDKQDEVVLQRGLDFSPFLKSGWFNDNHSKKTTDVLGYPEKVQKFQKGQILPDGTKAEANGTWAEGYLLNTPEAQKVWDLGLALQKAGGDRRLGFSIEGQVTQRTGEGGKTVAKALVRNVAVTNCPVGEGTRLEALAKSMRAAEDGSLDKALSVGTATPGVNPSAAGPVTGEGAGKVLTPQHLEDDEEDALRLDGTKPKDKEISKSEGVAIIQERMGCDQSTAERAFRLLQTITQQGLLEAT